MEKDRREDDGRNKLDRLKVEKRKKERKKERKRGK